MSVNKVEALRKVYYNLSGEKSKGNTASEVLQDIYKHLADEATAPSTNVTKLIDAIAEHAEGGGGGDFSTAEVTMVNTLEEEIMSPFPALNDSELKWVNVDAGETQVLKMPIPTGGATVNSTDLLGTVSGDITFEDGVLTITGNGTFTVTGID